MARDRQAARRQLDSGREGREGHRRRRVERVPGRCSTIIIFVSVALCCQSWFAALCVSCLTYRKGWCSVVDGWMDALDHKLKAGVG